jgi:hypothetical protein
MIRNAVLIRRIQVNNLPGALEVGVVIQHAGLIRINVPFGNTSHL